MCLYQTYYEQLELNQLAPYAVHSTDRNYIKRRSDINEKGSPSVTHIPEALLGPRNDDVSKEEKIGDPYGRESRYQTAFQIDAARIMGSKSFRRMEHKTQIFVSHVGDNYRTEYEHFSP